MFIDWSTAFDLNLYLTASCLSNGYVSITFGEDLRKVRLKICEIKKFTYIILVQIVFLSLGAINGFEKVLPSI